METASKRETGETKLDYHHQKRNVGAALLFVKQKFSESTKVSGVASWPPSKKKLTIAQENWKTWVNKLSMKRSILLDFIN